MFSKGGTAQWWVQLRGGGDGVKRFGKGERRAGRDGGQVGGGPLKIRTLDEGDANKRGGGFEAVRGKGVHGRWPGERVCWVCCTADLAAELGGFKMDEEILGVG